MVLKACSPTATSAESWFKQLFYKTINRTDSIRSLYKISISDYHSGAELFATLLLILFALFAFMQVAQVMMNSSRTVKDKFKY